MALGDTARSFVARVLRQAAIAASLLAAVTSVTTARSAGYGGSFTLAQADQGKAVYAANCAACHNAGLTGSSYGPALKGSAFFGTWRARNSDDLFGYIKTRMPLGSPGTLTNRETLAVTAFILQRNGHAAGGRPLVTGTPVTIVPVTAARPARAGRSRHP